MKSHTGVRRTCEGGWQARTHSQASSNLPSTLLIPPPTSAALLASFSTPVCYNRKKRSKSGRPHVEPLAAACRAARNVSFSRLRYDVHTPQSLVYRCSFFGQLALERRHPALLLLLATNLLHLSLPCVTRVAVVPRDERRAAI